MKQTQKGVIKELLIILCVWKKADSYFQAIRCMRGNRKLLGYPQFENVLSKSQLDTVQTGRVAYVAVRLCTLRLIRIGQGGVRKHKIYI